MLARQEWEHRAGWAGAYRELVGWDDEHDALGNAPAPAMAEKAALFRAAHRELGLLDVTDEEANLTDGQLRARVRGYEREEAWAPRYVAPELDATIRRREELQADATIWRARADAPDTAADEAAALREAAADASREAAELAARVAELEEVDDARAVWFTHTANSRERAHRSSTELRARGIDPDDPDDRVTADEWFDAHCAEQAEADRTRARSATTTNSTNPTPTTPSRRTTEADDARDRARAGRHPRDRDTGPDRATMHPAARRRVARVDETAQAVANAQAALAEIAQRQQADAERAARETEENTRRADLTRWHDEADDGRAWIRDGRRRRRRRRTDPGR